MAEEQRKAQYKNYGNSTDEMRRRRETEGVSLRKQKRDEQVSPFTRGGAVAYPATEL